MTYQCEVCGRRWDDLLAVENELRCLRKCGGQLVPVSALADGGPPRAEVSAMGRLSIVQASLCGLNDIARSLAQGLTFDEILPQVLDSLLQMFSHADRVCIAIREPDGAVRPRWRRSRKAVDGGKWPIYRTIAMRVMQSKQAQVFVNAVYDEDATDADVCLLPPFYALCAPLLGVSNEVFGVIQMEAGLHTSETASPFRSDDLELLVSVSALVALAYQNTELRAHLAREHQLEQDLALAQEVTKGFLPTSPAVLQGYGFSDYLRSAGLVGGDYYDYISLPDGRFAAVVCDVLGHGIAAAMLTGRLGAEIEHCFESEAEPVKAITRLNTRMCRRQSDRFVTALLVVLDPIKHQATIVNAGHMPPIWRIADGRLVEPGSECVGIPLGIVEGCLYEQTTIDLGVGDSLTLYTDGVSDALNPIGEPYGHARLRSVIQDAGSDVRQILRAIVDDVGRFMEDAMQADDQCIVCVSRNV